MLDLVNVYVLRHDNHQGHTYSWYVGNRPHESAVLCGQFQLLRNLESGTSTWEYLPIYWNGRAVWPQPDYHLINSLRPK